MRWSAILFALLIAISPADAYWQSRSQLSTCTPVAAPTGGIYTTTDFNDGNWTVSRGTFTFNQVSSPDCATNGALFVEDTQTNPHAVDYNRSFTTAVQAYTASYYVRQVTGSRNNFIQIFNNSSFANSASVGVALPGCTINVAAAVAGAWTAPSATATTVGSWCLVSLTFTATVDIGFDMFIEPMNGTSNSYTGDGTSSISVWGFKLQ